MRRPVPSRPRSSSQTWSTLLRNHARDERHLRRILAEWVPHYNRGRPHSSLGPAVPEPAALSVSRSTGHQLPPGHRVATRRPILGGLHHEYRLEPAAA
jgi:putative transposase